MHIIIHSALLALILMAIGAVIQMVINAITDKYLKK